MKKTTILLFLISLVGCGTKLSGTYAQDRPGQGKIVYDFKSNGKVTIEMVDDGIKSELPYEVDGKDLKLITPRGNAILKLVDAKTIEGPMGLRLVKEN